MTYRHAVASALIAAAAHVHGMTTALTRDGEYEAMSGATATE